MYFPGNDYITYIQNPSVSLDRVAYVAADFYRFLYTERTPKKRYDDDMRYIRMRLRDKDWEVVRISGRRATRITPDGETEYPVWELGRGRAFALKRYAANHDRVYIRNPLSHQQISRYYGPERRILRELWEINHDNPNCKFIVFGNFQMQLYFQFALAGGALRIREEFTPTGTPGKVRRFLDSDGSYVEQENAWDRDWTEDRFIERHDLAHNIVYIALCLLRNLPLYVQDLYSDVQRFKTPDGLLKDAYDRLKKLRPRDYFLGVHNGNVAWGGIWPLEGDRSMCDSCSLQYACRIYQKGGVCALPGTPGKRLSEKFLTRDSDEIIEGVQELLAFQVERLEKALTLEEEANRKRDSEDKPKQLNGQIHAMANDIQKNAISLAKLINPMLTRPQVAVQINTSEGKQVTMRDLTPQMQAAAIRELEQAGTPRSAQTPELILQHITKQQGGAVIQGEVVDGFKSDF
ncbi:hypothetical protein SEA_REYNAULD_14 [Rhodococcus phage Reynauld]|uniref:Uncharacterized protein n=1 Tax=Rhodococcus phage Reynauld TaxID=3062845 RepID=A0ACD4UI68_9CAUD|nr:hypothetical protein SEA_REYNAULD_14 [Rhodococcus phage Reynauld]